MKFTQSRINAYRLPAARRPHDEHELIDDAMPGFGIRWRAYAAAEWGEGAYFAKGKIGGTHSRLSLVKISKVALDEAHAEVRGFFGMIARRINPSTVREGGRQDQRYA